jgi:hypothetical protein
MWANSVWGLLGLSASCVLTRIGLGNESAWSKPLLYSALIFLVGSLLVLCWPLRKGTNRAIVWELCKHPIKGAVRLVEPIHVIILGLLIAAAGVGWQFYRGQSSLPPQSIPSDDGAIEWDSGRPKLVFDWYINGGIWIRELKISGRNRLDRPLKDCNARFTPDMTGKEVLFKIAVGGKELPADKELLIPPRASFDFFYRPPLPINAQNFLNEFGAIRFYGSCSVGTGGGSFNFDKFFDYADLEKQIQSLSKNTEREASQERLATQQQNSSPTTQPTLRVQKMGPINTINAIAEAGAVWRKLVSEDTAILITAPPENLEVQRDLSNIFMVGMREVSNQLTPGKALLVRPPNYEIDIDAPRLIDSGNTGIVIHGDGIGQSELKAFFERCFITRQTPKTPQKLAEYYKVGNVFWIEIGHGFPWKGEGACAE